MNAYKMIGAIGLSLSLALLGCQSINQNQSSEEFTQIGRAKMAGGDFKGAVKEFDTALERDPSNPDILVARGLARAEMGQLLMAIEDYTQALTENPNLHDAFIYRGNANNQLLQLDAALADFSQAIALQPLLDPQSSERALAAIDTTFTD